jgi:phage baseplate assembly protein W
MADNNSFLGRGWSFPPSFDQPSGEVDMLNGFEDIESSLRILLSTSLGERVMQPKFGCDTGDMIFETLDTTLETEMKNRIEVAILFFEPRIDIIKQELTQDNLGGVILLSLDYVVRATNTRGNLVFPFYLSEF